MSVSTVPTRASNDDATNGRATNGRPAATERATRRRPRRPRVGRRGPAGRARFAPARRAAGDTAYRLDLPATGRGAPRVRRVDREAVGRIAEVIARYLGTARYLAIQTVLVVIWIGLNIAIPLLRWDPYPFILLNLAFSTQAAYAAPLILLAQNRQDDRDRIALAEDRAGAVRVQEDTEFLAREVAALRIAQSDAATRQYLRGEMTNQLDALREDVETMLRRVLATDSPGAPASSENAPQSARHLGM